MPPEDDFTRERDPRRQTAARIVGLVVAAALVAAGTVVWLTRGQPQPTGVAPVTSTPSPTAPKPSGPTPTPVPSAPVLGPGFSVAEDGVARQLVTFGGVDSYDATWVWQGDRWFLARPTVSPPGRSGAAFAYDPLTGGVMLEGGRLASGQLVDDTWLWDGSTWRELDRGTGRPPPAEDSVMAWDPSLHEMVLVIGRGGSGGATWTWNGGRWMERVGGGLPSGTFLVGLAVDPATQTLLGASCCSVGQGATSTWAWDGTTWRAVGTRAGPAFTVALVLNPESSRPLLLGDPSLVSGREMWSWSGQDWVLLTGARLPAFPGGAVTDTVDGHVVVVGSIAEPVLGAPQLLHIWSLSGSAWRQLA
jgi:hypothetical protein